MILPTADWQGRPGMAKLLEALDAGAGSTRYVGGCVRDTLLGLDVSDVDLATRLTPEQVIARLKKAGIKSVPTGIAHGTVTAVIQNAPIEVTTLRRDVSTDGRRATVAFTEDGEEDALRRDFTVNALLADPVTLEVHDHTGGLTDLEQRRVRFIGDSLTRIAEDHLRILRFFRFHARFGAGEPDPVSLEACAARANDLMALSRERIADEILKLLALADPSPTVALMVERGLFRPVLPEITMDGIDRLRLLVAREKVAQIPPEPLRRLAALLPPDPALAASLSARLRLANRATKRMVATAQRPPETLEPEVLAYRIGAQEAVDQLLLSDEGPALLQQKVALLRDWQRPTLPLGGGDLIAMGLSPGPAVARTLQAIEREWAQTGFANSGEAVRQLARRHVDQALRESQ